MKRNTIIRLIIEKLSSYKPYIYNSATTGSVYMKFKASSLLCSIRIANHAGRKKYRYKWNLFKGIGKIKKEMDRGIERYYYDWKQEHIEQMVKDVNAFAEERGL